MITDQSSNVPGSSISIQQATWHDFSEIRQLEKACFPLDAWPLLDMIGALSFPSVERLKAVDAECIIGFVAADVRRIKDEAWIATICVHPDHQRQKTGSRLLAACEKQLAIATVKLSVRASNAAAIALYTIAGYTQTGTWPKYYKGSEDAVVMEKKIG